MKDISGVYISTEDINKALRQYGDDNYTKELKKDSAKSLYNLTKQVNEACSNSDAVAELVAGMLSRDWPLFHLIVAAFIAGCTTGIVLRPFLEEKAEKIEESKRNKKLVN